MHDDNEEVVIPVLREEVIVGSEAVVTGGVRVTKHVHSHDEVIEQELRKSHVAVKRVKLDRVVDGPLQSRREGNTLIIPVVSEILRVEKHWVLTEEIHITETVSKERTAQTVTLNAEEAEVQRLDAEGNVVPEAPVQKVAASASMSGNSPADRRILTGKQSILNRTS